MNTSKYIRHLLPLLACLLLWTGCKDNNEEITQQTEFSMRVGESVTLRLPVSSHYTITVGSPIIAHEQSGRSLTVKALKTGKTTLTANLDSGEKRIYTFTIDPNAYQIGFTIDSTPRIESWIEGVTVKTEETAGLQVSCEPGVGITGEETGSATRSYGFIYVESGQMLRLAADGDFTQKGTLNNGIAAMRDSHTGTVQYESCTVTIEKVNSDGKIWFTLAFPNRSDIRIVTEVF